MINQRLSNFLPPFYRDMLVTASLKGDIDEIDRITAKLAAHYPELVLPRSTDRPEFQPRAAHHFGRQRNRMTADEINKLADEGGRLLLKLQGAAVREHKVPELADLRALVNALRDAALAAQKDATAAAQDVLAERRRQFETEDMMTSTRWCPVCGGKDGEHKSGCEPDIGGIV